MIYAKAIADSIYHPRPSIPARNAKRITTMEVEIHRYMLPEFNTHRAFSRSSASSRAIPFHKQLDRVTNDIAMPAIWAAEQKGMQGGDEIENIAEAERAWEAGRDCAVTQATRLHNLGVHKSIVNRLLEPYMWHRIIVTATQWENFFRQRCSPLAQPEIRLVAEAMRSALADSTPEKLEFGQWHMPYIDSETLGWTYDEAQSHPTWEEHAVELQKRISVARCARVSYLTHDGVRDPSADLGLYDKLVTADPPHWAPLEHVATPTAEGYSSGGNFYGWTQLRSLIEAERSMDTKD
jgi:hypothetical protein